MPAQVREDLVLSSDKTAARLLLYGLVVQPFDLLPNPNCIHALLLHGFKSVVKLRW